MEMVAQERAALALWLLQQAPYTTQALAERLEMTHSGAWKLLHRIARVVPVYYYRGLWQVDK